MDNMTLWDRVKKTDPLYTKEYTGPGGYSGTSINGHYVVMKATEAFGPIGIGWGYEIVEERYDTGGVIMVTDDGEAIRAMTHTILLELWYMLDGVKGTVKHFGHTPYVYNTRNGIMSDNEAPKKSLTDALKKCLSMLGVCSDVWLGQFDDISYVQEVSNEFAVEKAEDKAAERDKQKRQYEEAMAKYLDQLEEVVTMPELEALYKESMRKAKYRNDQNMMHQLTAAKDKSKDRLTKAKGEKK